ncbi:MAG: FAD-dependent oxidoreductase [Prochlorothrix sp.]
MVSHAAPAPLCDPSFDRTRFDLVFDLIIVGSGITGLMTAYEAARSGYRVALLSKSPDPRTSAPKTTFEAATWDGYINRFITLAEGHPYFTLPPEAAVTHGEVGADFQRSIAEGGMLAQPVSHWDAATQQFLQTRQACDRNQAANLALLQDYLDENRTSLTLWYHILSQALQDCPDLLPELSLHSSGIDRLYTTPAAYAHAQTMQQQQNILKDSHGSDLGDRSSLRLGEADPSLAIYDRATAGGRSGAGVLTQYGVAFDVQVLGRQWLLPALERLGVVLGLGPAFRVVELVRDGQNRVQGLQTAGGQIYRSRHYVLHPGAYSEPGLLAQTPAQNRLAGVKGLWLRLKRADRLLGITQPPRPCKIHGPKAPIQYHGQTYPGQVTDLNVMAKAPTGDWAEGWDLVIGSGYLFQGFFPWPESSGCAENSPELPDSVALSSTAAERSELARSQPERSDLEQAELARSEALALGAIVQVVNQVYGLDLDLETVLGDGDPRVDRPSAGCLRSWSPDDRELRELLPTAAGGALIIHGGGNTGSTTKAPFTSQVTLQFLQKLDYSLDCEGDRAPVVGIPPNPPLEEGDKRNSSFSGSPLPIDRWAETYETLRRNHRTSPADCPPAHWQALEQDLTQRSAMSAIKNSRLVAPLGK